MNMLTWGCDCSAPEAVCHTETCGVTPIYAKTIRDIDAPMAIVNEIIIDLWTLAQVDVEFNVFIFTTGTT